MNYTATRLTDQHSFDWFDCGEPHLDKWAQTQALKDQDCGRSATHVWTDDSDELVVGYFTLLPTITREDDSGIFSIIKPKSFQGKEVPGVLIGKFALDRSLRGLGLGVELLADALVVSGEAMDLIGGVHVVVDPMDGRDKLREWYTSQGFRAIEGTDRLYLSLRE